MWINSIYNKDSSPALNRIIMPTESQISVIVKAVNQMASLPFVFANLSHTRDSIRE